MSIEAQWRGLSRLLLGAAFLLLGWLFVSATPASADDALTSVVGGVTQPVTSVTEPATASVAGVAEDVVTPDTEAAEDVVLPVVEAVEPAARAVEDSVTTTVTSAVETTTEVVETTVEATPVAPVVGGSVAVVTEIVRGTASTLTVDVVEPVVETVVSGVGTVVGQGSELPVEGPIPGPQLEAPGATGGASEHDMVATVRTAAAEGHAAYGIRVVGPAASLAAPDPAAPRTSAASATDHAAGIPQPPVRGPVPTGPEAGVLPAPSNASSGGSAGADAASTPLAFTLPEAASVTPLSAVQHPAAGPVPDPGSRPD